MGQKFTFSSGTFCARQIIPQSSIYLAYIIFLPSVLAEYLLTLVPIDDGLLHRPRAVWSIIYTNCELNDAEVWLKSALQVEDKKEVCEELVNSIFV